VLAHVDDDANAMAEADQLEDRLHQLEARICDAEVEEVVDGCGGLF
jgi:hypothetical protein